jgi:hypothetical protein
VQRMGWAARSRERFGLAPKGYACYTGWHMRFRLLDYDWCMPFMYMMLCASQVDAVCMLRPCRLIPGWFPGQCVCGYLRTCLESMHSAVHVEATLATRMFTSFKVCVCYCDLEPARFSWYWCAHAERTERHAGGSTHFRESCASSETSLNSTRCFRTCFV